MKNLRVCWISAGISSFIAGVIANDENPIDKWIYIDIGDNIQILCDLYMT